MATCISCQIIPVSYVEIHFWFVCCIIPFIIFSLFCVRRFCCVVCLFTVHIMFYFILIYPVFYLLLLGVR